jgi:hypothetical protein
MSKKKGQKKKNVVCTSSSALQKTMYETGREGPEGRRQMYARIWRALDAMLVVLDSTVCENKTHLIPND